MKKYMMTVLLLGAVTAATAQLVVTDPGMQVEQIAQGIKNAAASAAQIQQLTTMTKWIANTWSKASEGIKAFHTTQEFWNKSTTVLNQMGNVQGWIARDQHMISQSFLKRSQNVSKEVAMIMKDAYNDVQTAAGSTRLDFAKRVDLVNAGIVKLDKALALINQVHNAATNEYMETTFINNKSDWNKSVYDAYRGK